MTHDDALKRMHKLVGPPGTGKTHSLIDMVKRKIEEGVDPGHILFTTFTRAGANEARDRAIAQLKLSKESAPWFKTIHAIAYAMAQNKNLITGAGMCAFAKHMGLFFTLIKDGEANWTSSRGDYLLSLYGVMRARRQTPQKAYATRPSVGGLHSDVSLAEFNHFVSSFDAFKTTEGVVDFSDLLMNYIKDGPGINPVVAFLDEAQDTSKLQWDAFLRMCGPATTEIFVAGDDDQAIHEWNGADPKLFITAKTFTSTVLPQSVRVPRAVHTLAEKVSKRISLRLPKDYRARDADGRVCWISSITHIPLTERTVNGSWMILARNTVFLEAVERLLQMRGVAYTTNRGGDPLEEVKQAISTWQLLIAGTPVPTKQARALLSRIPTGPMLARGAKTGIAGRKEPTVTYTELVADYGLKALHETPWYELMLFDPTVEHMMRKAMTKDQTSMPSVYVSTIHGAKGMQADNVVLLTDMTQRTHQGLQSDPDQEHRVWYVAITRAKEQLLLVRPQCPLHYNLE